MNGIRAFATALSAFVAIVLAAGCSGNQQNSLVQGANQTEPLSSQVETIPAASTSVVSLTNFVSPSDYSATLRAGNVGVASGPKRPNKLYVSTGTSVVEYTLPNKNNSAPTCKLASDASYLFIAVNSDGVLYNPGSKYVLGKGYGIDTYGSNCGARGPAFFDPFGLLDTVAFDHVRNRVYVANYPFYGPAGPQIAVYARGSTYPTWTLHNSALQGSFGIAVNSAGDVFNSGQNTPSVIVEYPGGEHPGKVLPLAGVEYPLGLEFDHADNLIVTAYNGIFVYSPPYTGAPKETILLKGYSFFAKLDAANHNLYVSDFGNASVDVYTYPDGAYEYSITNGLKAVYGIAVDPASS